MTSKEESMIVRKYYRSDDWELEDCYKNYNDEKLHAFTYIRQEMEERNGWGLKIISYNNTGFTAGYMINDVFDGSKKLVYFTPNKRYELDTNY